MLIDCGGPIEPTKFGSIIMNDMASLDPDMLIGCDGPTTMCC
jgi:hypothetical protein